MGICEATKKRVCLVALLILATILCQADSVSAAASDAVVYQGSGDITQIADGSVITANGQHGLFAENLDSVISADDEVTITTEGDNTYGAYAGHSGTILIGSSADINIRGTSSLGVYSGGYSNIIIGSGANITALGNRVNGVYSYLYSNVEIGDGATINTLGMYGYGLAASSSADITAGDFITINTEGFTANGVYAYQNSNINIGDSLTLTTSGDLAVGVHSITGSNISIGDSAQITTQNLQAYGVYSNTGSSIDIGDLVTINTSGDRGHAVVAAGGSNVTIGDSARITTSNGVSYGIFAQDNSNIIIGSEAVITTSMGSSYGVIANTNSSLDIGASVVIATLGGAAHGAYSASNSKLNIGDGATITTAGASARGAYANGSDITIGQSATIITASSDAYGVYANNNSNITIGGSSIIATSGDNAHGFVVSTNSSVDIGDTSTIITSGNNAYGVYTLNNSSMDIGDTSTIITSGNDAYGIVALNNSEVTVGSSSNITTSGGDAYGLIAENQSSIEVGDEANITTTGDGAHAVYANNNASILLNGGQIVATGTDSLSVYSELDSQVTGSGTFAIAGDMSVNSLGGTTSTLIDLTLEDGSLFFGTTAYTSNDARAALNLTLNGSDTLWTLGGNSDLTNLYMNGATIDLTQAFGLTLTTINLGQSDTDSGIFRMETSIADEDADLLVILGEAQGRYVIDVVNSGADATTGLELTDLVLMMNEGQSAIFVLDHIVESGGWQFDLHEPDRETEPLSGRSLEQRATHQEVAWYLYSTGRASTAGSGAINSFAGSYLMAYAETNTLMQRMGELHDSNYLSGLWFRAHGGKFESNSKSYVRGFDMKYGGVQIGYDRKIEYNWNGDIYAGVMFGYSKGDLDYFSEGSGEVDSKTLGLYGTYVRPDGLYIDAVLKYQWMTNDFDVIDTAGTLVRGNDADTSGLGFSIEAGKRMHFTENQQSGWYAEPQIQLTYQRQSGDYFSATNGLNIGVDSFTSLLGRVGVLVGYETEKANFYGKVSRVKEFDGDLTIRANGIPIAESFDDSWWVYGLGFTSRVNDRNSLHLDIERTSGGSFRQPWRINAGWRMEF